MTQLNNLVSGGKDRKRIGRGGSRGGTSGRGSKGQKARSGGKVRVLFEGGQMPLHRRLPKRGFNNYRFKKEYELVSIASLEKLFSDGEQVNREILRAHGLISGKPGIHVKILGGSSLSKKLIVVLDATDALSDSARALIEQAGGTVQQG